MYTFMANMYSLVITIIIVYRTPTTKYKQTLGDNFGECKIPQLNCLFEGPLHRTLCSLDRMDYSHRCEV